MVEYSGEVTEAQYWQLLYTLSKKGWNFYSTHAALRSHSNGYTTRQLAGSQFEIGPSRWLLATTCPGNTPPDSDRRGATRAAAARPTQLAAAKPMRGHPDVRGSIHQAISRPR